MLEAEIQLIKRDLGIEDLDIRIEWVDTRWLSGRDSRNQRFTGSHQRIGNYHRVRLATQQSYRELVKTLAHELRHAWQFREGGPAVWTEMGKVLWKGTEFARPRVYRSEKVPYRQRPTEIDAYAYQDNAWARLFGGAAPKKVPTARERLRDMVLTAL